MYSYVVFIYMFTQDYLGFNMYDVYTTYTLYYGVSIARADKHRLNLRGTCWVIHIFSCTIFETLRLRHCDCKGTNVVYLKKNHLK